MPLASFEKLLSFIREDLEVNKDMAMLRGGPILPELALYATLRYLAGGSYSDIRFFTGISTSSLYRVIWKTIKSINRCKELAITFPQTIEEVKAAAKGFQSVSDQGCIWNCVSVLDGYHLTTNTPPKREVKNVRSFFSGHYQTYGVNVQAACDHNCRFTFIGVAGPGVMGDCEAVYEIELGNLVSKLPGLYCAIGDCAYTPTEHLIPIFGGAQAKNKRNDNFNFYASQLRIRIEMAFGLMVKKWGILQKPLTNKIGNLKYMVHAIGRLHNFCINERLQNRHTDAVFRPRDVDLTPYEQALRDTAANIDFDDMQRNYDNPWSACRDRMAQEIEALKLTRPSQSNRKRKRD